MYKPDLALNNLQWLLCHKIKPNQSSNLTAKTQSANFLVVLFNRKLLLPSPAKRLHIFPTEDRMLVLFTNPSARAGYDTRSIFKRSLTGLNSEFFLLLD